MPDRQRAGVGKPDKMLRVWDLESGAQPARPVVRVT
jgi:hypothetical protein